MARGIPAPTPTPTPAPAPAPTLAPALAAMNGQYYYPLIPHVSSSSRISGDEDMYKKFMFRKTLIVVACLLAAILVVAHWHTIARCIITAVSSRRRVTDQEDNEAEDVVLDTFKAEQGEDCKPLRPIQLVKFGKPSLTTTECTICLCEFSKGESIGVLPDCGHCFHKPCIGMWLFSHSSCPICRHSLEQQELEP